MTEITYLSIEQRVKELFPTEYQTIEKWELETIADNVNNKMETNDIFDLDTLIDDCIHDFIGI